MKFYFYFKKVKGKTYPFIKIRSHDIITKYMHRKQGEICKIGKSAIEFLLNDLITCSNPSESLISKYNLSSKLNFLTYSKIDDITTLTYGGNQNHS